MQAKFAFLLLRLLGLFPLGFVRKLGGWTAWLLLRFKNDMVFITRRNIQLTNLCDDSESQRELTRRSVTSNMQTAFEMPVIWRRSNAWLNKKITEVKNPEILEEAVASNKGVIVLCPHVGNWEVFGRKLPEYAPTTNLYQPPKQEYLESLVRSGREKSGATLVPTSQRGIAALLKALKKGEITGILPDQQPKRGSGLYVPFCGVPAYTMTMIHSLVQKTQCKVVLGYAIRCDEGFKIIFKSVSDDLYSDDQLESLVALSRAVEASLEEDPSQYQWSYKRYKYQPDEFKPYKKKLSEQEATRFNR